MCCTFAVPCSCCLRFCSCLRYVVVVIVVYLTPLVCSTAVTRYPVAYPGCYILYRNGRLLRPLFVWTFNGSPTVTYRHANLFWLTVGRVTFVYGLTLLHALRLIRYPHQRS